MFTAEQRAGYLGASDMPFIMNAEPERLLKWWEEKVGLREPDPPTWAMKLGTLVGDAIVDEYQEQSGDQITRRQEVVPSPINNRFRSTLDGFRVARHAVIEAKFASPFLERDKIFLTYYPQVAMQMHCVDATTGFLVVAQGTNDIYEIECLRNAEYEQHLLERADAMLDCMDRMVPPVDLELPVIVPPEKWRTVDLGYETPNWADEMINLLSDYGQTTDAALEHELAGRAAKDLVPDDVGKVLTPLHIIARNKKGSLAITRRKS